MNINKIKEYKTIYENLNTQDFHLLGLDKLNELIDQLNDIQHNIDQLNEEANKIKTSKNEIDKNDIDFFFNEYPIFSNDIYDKLIEIETCKIQKLRSMKHNSNHKKDIYNNQMTNQIVEIKDDIVKQTIFETSKKNDSDLNKDDNVKYFEYSEISNGTRMTIDGDEYILIYDNDATLKKYESEGFSKNVYGHYFNPWIDEYDPNYSPINDPEFQIIIYYKAVKVVDEDSTLRKYNSEGYNKNAYGEYFNPWIDEYDSNYNPINDPEFQIFFTKYILVDGKNLKPTVNVKNNNIIHDNNDNTVSMDNTSTLGQDTSNSNSNNDNIINNTKDDGSNDLDQNKDTPNIINNDDEFVTATINISGPDKFNTTFKIPVKSGLPLYADNKNKELINKTFEEYYADYDDEYRIKSATVNGQTFDLVNTPINEDINIDINIERVIKHDVTINIYRPDGSKNITIPLKIEDGNCALNKDTEDIIKNACKDAFGNDCEDYVFDDNGKLKEPIIDHKTINVNAYKQYKVTFINENSKYEQKIIEGQYLDPNLVERMSRAVNYGYNLDSNDPELLKGQPKNLRDEGKLKKAFTGLKYWGNITNGKDENEIEKFKFNQPIYSNITLEAQTGIKGKSVVATAAGVALGAGVAAMSPIGSTVASVSAGIVDRVGNYQLKHPKQMTTYDEINKLTGIKKASEQLKNHFKQTQTIKDLQYFARGVIIGAAAVNIGKTAHNYFDKLNTPTPDNITQPTVEQSVTNTTEPTYSLKSGNEFDIGFRDSYNAVGNTNSVSLNTTLTGKSNATSLYDIVSKQWIQINETTLAEAAKEPARYAVRYMSQSGDTMWEPLEQALVNTVEQIGGAVR